MTPRLLSQNSLTALLATLMSVALLASGCAAAAREAGTILLKIGEEVIVSLGADYLKKILSPDEAAGQPTIIVSNTNAAGYGVGTNFAVSGSSGIGIEHVEGTVYIVSDGNGLAITVAPGSTATIELHTTGSARTAPVATGARDQAATVDGIIRWSGRSRQALFAALDDLGACHDAYGATQSLRTVASGRAGQVAALNGLDVSALPSGPSLRGTLISALNSSREADLAFVRWGEHVQASGCGHDSNYQQGMAASKTATRTKQRFVNAWNPVALAYGLPTYEEPGI
ncbi:hypothetical protein [Hamadaea tsunoensis]|uniref:hypothetical protein n=1 Tax=Hamadaea tsunoensis TaxID=53368 RepID=UPI0012FADCEC|nr:hypothetical protein [Hamadaea tsunoensis]